MPGAPAQDIHRRAYAKYIAGEPLDMMEKVALRQVDLDASQAAGQPVTIGSYSGGANAQYGRIGETIGKGLKIAAPIAAMAIPGLGPMASAAIAAGGQAAGGALAGERFDPLKTALSAAAAYGSKQVGMGKSGAAGAGATPAEGGGGGGGFFNTLGGYAKDALSQLGGGNPLLGGASLALGALSAREASKQRRSVEATANYRNQLLSRGLGQAEEAYANRAPLREGGMAAIGKYLANPRGLFQTPGEGAPAPAPAPTPPPQGNAMQMIGAASQAMMKRRGV